jgi:hypothetical protein
MKNPSGFHFISIDSVPRSIAIRREIPSRLPGAAHGQVSAQRRDVKDLQSGGAGRGQLQARSRPALIALTMRPIDHESHKSTIFFMLGPSASRSRRGRPVGGEDVESTLAARQLGLRPGLRLRSGCGRDPDRLAWTHPSG